MSELLALALVLSQCCVLVLLLRRMSEPISHTPAGIVFLALASALCVSADWVAASTARIIGVHCSDHRSGTQA